MLIHLIYLNKIGPGWHQNQIRYWPIIKGVPVLSVIGKYGLCEDRIGLPIYFLQTTWRGGCQPAVTTRMMTSSNGNIFRVTGHLCGEFTGHRNFDVFFDLRLNKRLSKQSRGWWFETPVCPLWRHCNAHEHLVYRWICKSHRLQWHQLIFIYVLMVHNFIIRC